MLVLVQLTGDHGLLERARPRHRRADELPRDHARRACAPKSGSRLADHAARLRTQRPPAAAAARRRFPAGHALHRRAASMSARTTRAMMREDLEAAAARSARAHLAQASAAGRARKLSGGDHRRGHVGRLRGDPAGPGGHSLHDHREEPGGRRQLVREFLSRMRGSIPRTTSTPTRSS